MVNSSQTPAIVIATHARPDELRRLGESLARAVIPAETTLIISVDGGADEHDAVLHVAHAITWNHGPKQILTHDHLGLVDHFLLCGDLTATHGSIVFLEDDLVLGPAFYQWASTALKQAAADPRIAGVSLATPHFDGYQHLPFEPVLDGSDGLYMQVPWYDGMAWTADMWQRYREHPIDPTTKLHTAFDSLGDDEWFPDAVRYLIETSRYYLLPRHAHVTNSGAAGTHFDSGTDYFQVPLTLRGPDSFAITPLDDALAVYDDHMELSPESVRHLVPALADKEFVVDLLGTRDLSCAQHEFVLTSRLATDTKLSWGASMHPLIANLVCDTPGDALRLATTSSVALSAESCAVSRAILERHAARGRSPSNRDSLQQVARNLRGVLRRGG